MPRAMLATFLVMGGGATPALAKDETLCRAGFVCASYPEGVLRAMTDAGLTAKLGVDRQGDPSIEGEGAGYKFDVFFYGCENKKQCDSLQFQVSFSASPELDTEFANKWNVSKRFLQAGVRENGVLAFSYDLTTVGGVSADNFDDVLVWWQVMLDEVGNFFDANRPKDEKPADAPAADPVVTPTAS